MDFDVFTTCCSLLLPELLFLLYMKYEPPQFYLSRNMRDEAEKALGITHKERSMETGIRRVNNDIKGKTLLGASISLIGMLCQKKFSKMTRMAFILSICSIRVLLNT